jgi:hypothetical protein
LTPIGRTNVSQNFPVEDEMHKFSKERDERN